MPLRSQCLGIETMENDFEIPITTKKCPIVAHPTLETTRNKLLWRKTGMRNLPPLNSSGHQA